MKNQQTVRAGGWGRWLASCAFAVGSLWFAGAVQAAPLIDDQAGLFSPEAVKTAEQALADVAKQIGHEVRVETYATVPANREGKVAEMSATERDRFYGDWLRARAQETKAAGMLVLITKEPRHVHAGFSESLKRAGYTRELRSQLVSAVVAQFKEGKYDQGLEAIGSTFSNQMSSLKDVRSSNVGAAATESARPLSAAPTAKAVEPAATEAEAGQAPADAAAVPPVGLPGGNGGFSIMSLLTIAGVVVGGLLIVSLIGRMLSGAFGGGGMGGGGMMGGLLAGLGGAIAGNWLYDSFMSPQAHAGDAGATGADTGASGAESADASSGWDTGGSDFGGGDFGGGDFGGGGEW
jgi:uncharacterized membrane protein YgcG